MHDNSVKSKLAGRWQYHQVCQYDPYLQAGTHKISALLQIVTEELDCSATVPYLAYMPERDRLIMLANCGISHSEPHLMFSDDHGATWTDPKPARPDIKCGLGVGLAYLGKGRVMFTVGDPFGRFFSDDFGETWSRSAPMPTPANGLTKHEWDPPFVDRDPSSGEVLRIVSTAYQSATFFAPEYNPDWGCIRISTDRGQTWSADELVPQWRGVNEVALVRAANGDLVAACRTAFLEETLYYVNVVAESDHYEGLAYSISKDNGQTWSDMRILYRYGRHHPSMVVLPNDDIVMTYVVRKGCPKHPSGYDQYAVEALVSHDHGQTWDLERPYVLHRWSANRTDENAWWASSQCTSTVLLPDGDILTCFGTGYRCGPEGHAPRDVGLLRWRTQA